MILRLIDMASDVKKDVEIIKRFYNELGFYSTSIEARTREVAGAKNLLDLVYVIDKFIIQ